MFTKIQKYYIDLISCNKLFLLEKLCVDTTPL